MISFTLRKCYFATHIGLLSGNRIGISVVEMSVSRGGKIFAPGNTFYKIDISRDLMCCSCGRLAWGRSVVLKGFSPFQLTTSRSFRMFYYICEMDMTCEFADIHSFCEVYDTIKLIIYLSAGFWNKLGILNANIYDNFPSNGQVSWLLQTTNIKNWETK